MKYRNTQADIGFEFDYTGADETELRLNFEGILFNLLEFISEYNLEEECVDYLNLSPEYDMGTDFRAFYLKDIDKELYFEKGILKRE